MSLRTELDEILKNFQTVPSKTADDPITDFDWNAIASNLSNLRHALEVIRDLPACTIPHGFLYVRFPGKPLPYDVDGMFPWTTKSDWQNLTTKYPGTFLRLAGGDASTFQSETDTVTYDSGVKGTGGGQMDALQTHKHGYSYEGSNGLGSQQGITGKYQYQAKTVNNDTGEVKGARSTSETRPKNITVEVYMYLLNG